MNNGIEISSLIDFNKARGVIVIEGFAFFLVELNVRGIFFDVSLFVVFLHELEFRECENECRVLIVINSINNLDEFVSLRKISVLN